MPNSLIRPFLVALSLLLTAPLTHASGEHGRHGAKVGRPAKAVQATRTIELTMDDSMRFSRPELTIRLGETVRFIVRNDGRLKHEMVLGTPLEIKEHAKLMARFPGMEHDDPNAVTIDPGTPGELTWTFNRTGTFTYACLVAGHFEAGMHGRIVVR